MDNEETDQTANTQADLSLRWKYMSDGTFSSVADQTDNS